MIANSSDQPSVSSSQDRSVHDDDEYFGSYSHFSIHHEMLTDHVRTESYKEAIMKNSNLFCDKTVLDVGCGTGILSMFCCSAGASTVYGIDQSEIIHFATDIVMYARVGDPAAKMEQVIAKIVKFILQPTKRGQYNACETYHQLQFVTAANQFDEQPQPIKSAINAVYILVFGVKFEAGVLSYRENGFHEKINLIKGRLENITLPQPKVDIIVSEWMGYFLLFECMLETIIYARDKYLAHGGLILPDKFTIFLAGASDLAFYSKNVLLWKNVYGYKMTCMKKELLQEACIETVKEENIVTSCCAIKTIDMYTCNVCDIEFTSNFELEITQNKPITSIIGYFDTLFEENLNTRVKFSTSPRDSSTHWKQTVFVLPEPIEKLIGEKVIGRIKCKRQVKDSRSLIVTLTLDGTKHVYRIQ
ncbi:Protein arginine N-methyltransferase 3 [Nymphon striatum]|nr:Protein arginine N-methyltransferase 3 [Nymphon striatum]